jgi:DNA-binding beta-propeller fold protein YncE
MMRSERFQTTATTGFTIVSRLSLIGLALVVAPHAFAEGGYKLVKTIDLPGDKGGHGDWTTFDPQTNTVWLSQSPDHNVVVIDAATNEVKGVVPGIEDGNGIAVTPEYAFLSDNKGNVTVVVDKHSLQKVATLRPEGKGPNGTTYVSKTGHVYISTDSNDMTVFKAKQPFDQVAHFRLRPDPAKDGPDVALYVAAKDRLYQPDDNSVDVIDPGSNKVVAVWKPGIEGQAKPVVYDGKTNHFLLGTTDLKMLVLDGNSGKALASVPVKGKVDETVIDEGARRAYVGDKAGLIEVIDLDSNKVIDTLPSEPNVHTLTVDPKTHAVYVYRNESNKVDVFQPQRMTAK